MKRKAILCLALLISAFFHADAQTTAIAKPTAAEEAELRRQSFEKVWNTINEKHYDKTFGGVDWRRVREIYEPKATAAKSRGEFHSVLNRMLGELKLSHFGVMDAQAQFQTGEATGGVIGVELKMIDGQAVISRVEAGSSAEKAGLKPGFAVEKIEGRTTGEILAPLEKYLADTRKNEQTKLVYRERVLQSFIDGKPETTVKLDVLNGENRAQTFAVKRAASRLALSEAVGNFPPQEIVFESRRLAGNVGYIRFNMWIIPQMPKIRQAVAEFADARGIIFDLRGNPGGFGGMAPGVAGLLVGAQTSLGSMTGRETELKFIVYPQPKSFAGKVKILSDHGTGSTSEIFAAGLQEIGRARVVGERSMGAVLPSVFDRLPTGATFQYAISDYKSPKNVLIEGRGVAPDTVVKQTRGDLLAGRDLPLEEAVRQILN